jgi:hypothetical protein
MRVSVFLFCSACRFVRLDMIVLRRLSSILEMHRQEAK